MATAIRIEDLCRWSPPKRVETRNGPRNLLTAAPGDTFWSAWRSSKDSLRAAGVGCGKTPAGDWQAQWWQPLPEAEREASEAAVAASRATDADVDLPCPEGLAYLPFQRAGIAYAIKSSNVLFGDEMGLGKTIQAIGVFNADPSLYKVLVLCPASLRLNWRKEFEKWATRPVNVAVVNGGKASDFPKGEFNVLVVNYDVAGKHRKAIDAVSWDLLISDECHLLKNPKAIRTKAVLGSVTRGKRTADPIQARRKLFLTGTPIVNRPIELWPLVEALDPSDLGANFMKFAIRYCNAHQERFGWDFSGASRLDELQRKLREKFMVRRLKADVLTELPPKRYQVIEVPANGAAGLLAEEKRLYEGQKEYMEELEARIAEAEAEAKADHADMIYVYGSDLVQQMYREHAAASRTLFEEMSKIRREIGLAKVPAVIDHLTECLEAGPVVCFAWHKDVIAQLAVAFPGRCVTLTGDTGMEARQDAVDAFQAGKADLFLGNIQAAGVGITLTRSAHVVFAEADWVPGNLNQAIDRTHRIGQKNSVLVQYVVLDGSLDAKMAAKTAAKQAVIDRALDSHSPTNYGEKGAESVLVTTKETERQEVRAAAEVAVTPEQAAAALLAMRRLAGVCDGARALDGAGFNRFDAEIGHKLASLPSLSPRQCLLAVKLANKYRGQLGAELVAKCKGE